MKALIHEVGRGLLFDEYIRTVMKKRSTAPSREANP